MDLKHLEEFKVQTCRSNTLLLDGKIIDEGHDLTFAYYAAEYDLKRSALTGSLIDFSCSKCKKSGVAYYDSNKHRFVCIECKHIRELQPTTKICSRCKFEYTEYTWFDPNYCSGCGKSFVD